MKTYCESGYAASLLNNTLEQWLTGLRTASFLLVINTLFLSLNYFKRFEYYLLELPARRWDRLVSFAGNNLVFR